jgi:3-hydroxyisobutyrate dehydrogenase
MAKYAFLGMGVMGSLMASNMLKGGFQTSIWNRTANQPGLKLAIDAGCMSADSISQAAKDADFILTCVSDVPDVEEVLLGKGGVSECAKKGAIVVDLSTIGIKAAQSIGSRLKDCGLKFLDAPVSGGDIGAQNGTLTIMVGGDVKDFEEVLPVLKSMGGNVHHCGPTGSGQGVKLINQNLCAIHMVALSESMRLAQVLDVDPKLVVEICSTGAAGSWALSNLGPKMIDSDYSAGFRVKDILKDLRLINEELSGKESLPGLELSQELFRYVDESFPKGEGNLNGTQAMEMVYKKELHKQFKLSFG